MFILLTVLENSFNLVYLFGFCSVSIRFFLSKSFNKHNKVPYGTLIANITATIIESTLAANIVY